jgi:hypothetical protein
VEKSLENIERSFLLKLEKFTCRLATWTSNAQKPAHDAPQSTIIAEFY